MQAQPGEGAAWLCPLFSPLCFLDPNSKHVPSANKGRYKTSTVAGATSARWSGCGQPFGCPGTRVVPFQSSSFCISTFSLTPSLLAGLQPCVEGEHIFMVSFRKTETENPVSAQNCIQFQNAPPHCLLGQTHTLCGVKMRSCKKN